MVCVGHTSYEKIVEKSGSISGQRKCCLVARDDHTAYERCSNVLLPASDGMQVYKYTDRKNDRKRSLTNGVNLECSVVDSAADADMNMVPMVSASGNLWTLENMTSYSCTSSIPVSAETGLQWVEFQKILIF